MNVTGKTRIYRKDFNGKQSYSRAIASKKFENGHQTDQWIRAYEPVQLPRGTELEDGTDINVQSAFESVFQGRDGTVRRKLVITQFETSGASSGRAADAPELAPFSPIDMDDIPF